MEFYFKKEELLQLLTNNPHAKGVIVSQEILPRKEANGDISNRVYIRARISGYSTESSSTAKVVAIEGSEEIDGCPYPPGCTE